MKISVFVYGSRGDVQPMLALALELRKRRHEILLIANPENLRYGVRHPLRSLRSERREQMAINAKNKTSPLRASMSSFKEFKKITGTQITDLPGIIDGTDLVLNAGMGLGVHTVADIKGIPYRFVIFYPMLLGTGNPRSLPSRIKAALMNAGGNAMLKGLLNQGKKGSRGRTPHRGLKAGWATMCMSPQNLP
ncbi:MAG: glycosyltransferase [Bacteroidales bacterium]